MIRLFYNKAKPALNQVLERGIQHQFDISPIATRNPEEHVQLAKYLIGSILTIDLWNAADETHFATCKVPLAGILRQGKPQRTFAGDFEVYDPTFNSWVGTLQLNFVNEGSLVAARDMP